MSITEIFAVIFGVISVYLTVKENIWCWPTGIIMVILYIFVFYDVKLYSDVILQVIYIFMQAYGWYHWVYGDKNKKALPVTRVKNLPMVLYAIVIFAGAAGWGYLMHTYTDAAFPYIDSLVVTASLVAQWFLAKKYLESWVIWILVDVVAVTIYALKALYLTSGLYVVFLVLAIMGLLEWYKSYKKTGNHLLSKKLKKA
jgi:nicotinamide mononucleotide transporter